MLSHEISLTRFQGHKSDKTNDSECTNNQTAPLNDPSKASMTKPIVKGAMKPANCIFKLPPQCNLH